MVLLESLYIPLGTKMPSFELKDPEGKEFKSEKLLGKKGLLIAITCNHCPYAQAVWPRFIEIANQFKSQGINTVAINPNIHPDYPEDSPENMLKLIKQLQIKFPYLVDNTQNTAKSYKAQCTPDTYLLNEKHELVYHGRIDDNWQDPEAVTKHDLQEALASLVKNAQPLKQQLPSMGCSIKWRKI